MEDSGTSITWKQIPGDREHPEENRTNVQIAGKSWNKTSA